MGDFFFAIKMVVFTIILVLLMQIKVGPKTIESHTLAMLHDSAVVDNLRGVAGGAIKAGAQGYHWIGSLFEGVGDRSMQREPQVREKERESFWGFRRSDAYYRQQEKKNKERSDSWEETSEVEGPNGDEID